MTTTTPHHDVDVLVVGAGNAALCAALAAAEAGASVLVLERAPESARGGNSAFTGGAFRVAYDGVQDISRLVADLSADELATSDFGAYPAAQYFDDLIEMSGMRADADLVEVLVNRSFETLQWMRTQGVRFIPIHGRQSFLVDGKHRFWGGLTIENFRNYTYSRMGAAMLKQPGSRGWQIFEARGAALLPDEYRVRHATRYQSDTLEGLVEQLDGVDQAQLLRTLREFNAAVDRSVAFNPAVLDGRSTRGLAVDKTHWALPLEQGPFVAFEVSCGITCTYAGLSITPQAAVLDEEGRTMPGLYAAGEMVGGLYYNKYPGGAGLTSGAVFGRIAGAQAAQHARARQPATLSAP